MLGAILFALQGPPPLVTVVTPPPTSPIAKQVELLSSSLSKDTIEFSTAGNWHIRIDPSLNASCFSLVSFSDSTVMRLALDASKSNAYLILSNPYWRSLKTGFKENIVVTMSAGERWEGEANGLVLDDRPSLSLLFEDFDFMGDLAKSSSISLSWLGKNITALDMKDARFAISEIGRCQEVVEKTVDPFASSPFSQPNQ